MRHTKIPRTAQDRQGVIDEQAAAWVEADVGLQRIPELSALLGEAIVVGADQTLEVGRQLDPFQFQRQRIAVGVGNQDDPLAGLLDRRQKSIGIRRRAIR